MNKIILVDCDGVLLDWKYSFHRFLLRHGYISNDIEIDPTCYNISSQYKIGDVSRLTRLFNESAFMYSLPPLRDAVKYVKKMFAEHGYQFHVITSQTNLPQAQQLRIKNLENTFGKEVFHGFTFLDCGGDKELVLQEWAQEGDYYWIEDKIENAMCGLDVGLQPILMRHDYNEISDKQIPGFWSWKEIYEHITHL